MINHMIQFHFKIVGLSLRFHHSVNSLMLVTSCYRSMCCPIMRYLFKNCSWMVQSESQFNFYLTFKEMKIYSSCNWDHLCRFQNQLWSNFDAKLRNFCANDIITIWTAKNYSELWKDAELYILDILSQTWMDSSHSSHSCGKNWNTETSET